MVGTYPPVFGSLAAVSVTEAEVLRCCPLQLAYRRSGHGTRKSTPWARLGTVCHEVLEQAARSELGEIDEVFDDRFTQIWNERIGEQERQAAETGELELYGPATGWPTYATKRARLRRRARELTIEATSWRDREGVRIEERLQVDGEALYGYVDLVVRDPGPYRVIDYKSGVVTSPSEDLLVDPGYRRQVLLYAYLESIQPGGGRPVEGQVVPLAGDVIRFPIDWVEVGNLVSETHGLINEAANATEPVDLARPSAQHCRCCTYAARCPAFLSELTPELDLGSAALVGTVVSRSVDPSGQLTIDLNVERGTVAARSARVERIDPRRFSAIAGAATGWQVSCVGLRLRRGAEDEFLVTPRTVIEVL